LDKEQEKWAIFWCALLSPVIYAEIDPDLSNQFLKQLAAKEIRFPDGRIGKPSLSTLRRKLNRYRQGGFDAVARKIRNDHKKPRNIPAGAPGGSGQVNLPISYFIHSKTIGFYLLYRYFRYRKKPYRATGTPEVRSLPPSSEHGGRSQSCASAL
jgi:hypothetical protein